MQDQGNRNINLAVGKLLDWILASTRPPGQVGRTDWMKILLVGVLGAGVAVGTVTAADDPRISNEAKAAAATAIMAAVMDYLNKRRTAPTPIKVEDLKDGFSTCPGCDGLKMVEQEGELVKCPTCDSKGQVADRGQGI